MTGFEWWTGSVGQWVFVAMVIIPCVVAVAMDWLVRQL